MNTIMTMLWRVAADTIPLLCCHAMNTTHREGFKIPSAPIFLWPHVPIQSGCTALNSPAVRCLHFPFVIPHLTLQNTKVVYGGRLDIDVEIINGIDSEVVIWNEKRSSTGSHTFQAGPSSTYGVCFSNKMSSMSHKTIYFDFVSRFFV